MNVARRLLAVLLGLGVSTVLLPVKPHAQGSFPTQRITILVGYGPGGFPDVTTRIFAQQLSKELQTPIVVENRASAGTFVAGSAVAQSAPDGYTLLAADSAMWGITPAVFKSMPFNPQKDFIPIGIMATTPVVLVTSSHVPLSTDFKQTIDFFREHPGKFNYGTAGTGGFHHLIVEILQARTGINLQHIPYKSSSQILNALAAGEIAMAFQSPTQIRPLLDAGKLRAVAVTNGKRLPSLPEVPTLVELGITDLEVYGVMGLMAPAKTPRSVVQRLSEALRSAAADPEVRKRLAGQATEAVGSTSEEMAKMMSADAALYAEAAQIAKIQPR